MKKLTLDDHELLIKAKWQSPEKYKRKLQVTSDGYGHSSIGWDKSLNEILEEVRKDLNLDENHNPLPKKKWYQVWK